MGITVPEKMMSQEFVELGNTLQKEKNFALIAMLVMCVKKAAQAQLLKLGVVHWATTVKTKYQEYLALLENME